MMSRKVPDLLVEQLVLGELPEPRAAEVRAELEAEPGGLARLEEVRASSARILAQHPPALVRRELERRSGRTLRRLPRTSWLLAASALGAAAFALVAMPKPADDTRIKGGPSALHVYRQNGAALQQLHAGDTARPGDLVQLSITGPRPFATIVSVDGAGNVTVHYPDGPRAAPVEPGEHPLPRAFQLDAAPRFERFVLVTAPHAFDVETIVAAARTANSDALALPAGFEQTSLLLRKVSP